MVVVQFEFQRKVRATGSAVSAFDRIADGKSGRKICRYGPILLQKSDLIWASMVFQVLLIMCRAVSERLLSEE